MALRGSLAGLDCSGEDAASTATVGVDSKLASGIVASDVGKDVFPGTGDQ